MNPNVHGMMKKNTITSPCVVTAPLYSWDDMSINTPEALSSVRMRREIIQAKHPAMSDRNIYRRAIRRWFIMNRLWW